jgi:hypothetical protein
MLGAVIALVLENHVECYQQTRGHQHTYGEDGFLFEQKWLVGNPPHRVA